MKKELILSVALLGAVAALVSCQKTQNDIPEAYSFSVEASKAAVTDPQTKALALDGSAITATWATTENVYVKKGESWATGSLQPQAAGASATLKGTLSGVTFAANDNITLQFPKSGDITYSGQVGTLEDIAANFDWATANATIASVDEGKITVSDAVTFTNQQAIVKFTLKNGEADLSATKLVVKVGAAEYEVNPASATNEIYVALPGCSDAGLTLTATGSDSKTYSYYRAGVTFENGKYYTRTVKMAGDALPGLFSVSASQKVKFAKGNLTYSGDSWAFLSNSWTYNASASTDNKVNKEDGSQHFNWGVVFKEASSGESDVVDEITGVLGSSWRGLSLAEWRYLLGYDGSNSGAQTPCRSVSWHKYAKIQGASVGTGDKRYLLIFPDTFAEGDWNESSMGTKPTNFDGTAEDTIAYTEANFTAMQDAGIVILPAAGYRNDSSWSYVGNLGIYWFSTSLGASSAYRLSFSSGNVLMSNFSKAFYYFPVRLVQNN